ncbi:ABC transporter substrate-binding protein [Microbacterium sp. Root180]|uniref:ABC transporter substrate-binding protein n=1 Tax=Microbacterium sp. Root180 TaxID=1736483 RepID=UPI0006FA603F|nr:ABC transporter substrate-binding protein [Microbacterium sp. Root180]KRB35204.1 ABC transporter substrate-binding protein [Microbacterium sp. Root180]
MKRIGIAAAAVACASLLVLTACAPRDGGGTDDGDGNGEITLVDAQPAGTQPVDEVTWAIAEGEPATLNPASSANLIIPNLCDNLLSLQPDFSIEPGIAETAEFVDPTTFVITLRDDVTFWDGSPVTADDVVYSLQQSTNPASQWYGAFALVVPDPAVGIVATAPNEVTVRFVAPDSTFRDALAGQGGAVMQKAFGEAVGDALGTSDGGLMCTGPYKLEEGGWTPGSDIVTTANEDYWNGAPLVKELTYTFVSDGSTLTSALTAGEIDGAFNVPPSSRAAFEGDGAGTLTVGNSTASYSFGPASSTSAAANPQIRQALSMAIDREKYLDTVVNGLGYVQKTLVPPFSFQSMDAASIYEAGYEALAEPTVDIEGAKKLVESSGEDLSVPLVVAVPAGATQFQQTAAIIQSAGKEIGLDIQINEMQASDFGALFYDPSKREGVDFVATQGYLETPGVLGYPSLFLLPEQLGGFFNWSGYDNPEVTAHMAAARNATDPTTAAEEYVAAQEIFAPDYLQVTLAGTYQLTYLSKDLTGVVTSIAAYSSPWALHLGGK